MTFSNQVCNITQVRYFQEEDIDIINRNPDNIVVPKVQEHLLLLASSGFTYTVVRKNKPIAIIGGHILWRGVAQVWAIVSPEAKKSSLYLTKISNLILEGIADKFNIHRFHCIVDATSLQKVRWLYLLKFKYESTMRMASSEKTDVYIYARLETNNDRWPRSTFSRYRTIVAELLQLT